MGDVAAPSTRPSDGCSARPLVLLVMIPCPGHLFPFSNFAYKLAAAGMQVTCLSSGYVFENLQQDSSQKSLQINATSLNDMVRFEHLLENCKPDREVKVERVMEWIQDRSNEEMQEVLEQRILGMNPKPCCIVSDMLLGWVQHVANKFKVPRHTLFTMPAKNLAFVLAVPEAVKKGVLPYAGGDEKEISLPGTTPIQPGDVWEPFKDRNSPHHIPYVENFSRLHESSCIFVNTIQEWEADTLKAMRNDYVAANIKVPEILPIGPLHPDIARMGHGFDKRSGEEVSEAEKWLDTQAPESVLYVSFGSLASLREEQIGKLALALEATNHPFLWVLRPPENAQVNESATQNCDEFFPPGFQERVKGRAMLINGWAPQPKILAHKATGAFLSHCGWNSVLESLCCGIPLLAWPFFGDQQINARFITESAKVGLRIHKNNDSDIVEGEQIEKSVKLMMEDEEGKAARCRAREFQKMAQKAVGEPGGSSTRNLDTIFRHCSSPSPEPSSP